VKPSPDPSDFPLAVETEDDLTLEEVSGAKVQVVGHKVQFDPNRQLWFCDIQINPESAYFPFVRLALVRYQPKSIKNAKDDCKLSKVVIADFAQLVPDRTAGVSFDAAGRLANVSVMGGAAGTQMEATLETRQAGVPGALGWVPVPDSTAELAAKAISDRISAWTGRLQLPGDQPPERFRVVVKEYELYRVDPPPPGERAPAAAMMVAAPMGRRLVYADVLRLGRPAAGPAEEEEG